MAASHPFDKQWWWTRGRKATGDEPTCDDCGGVLSFEHHDAWHKIALWNRTVQERAEAERQKTFEKAVEDREQTRRVLAGKPDPNAEGRLL